MLLVQSNLRINACLHLILNVSAPFYRYTTLKHNEEEKSKDRFNVLKDGHLYYERDGLNNIEYKLLGVKKENLFTNITVDAYKIQPWPKKIKAKIAAHKKPPWPKRKS